MIDSSEIRQKIWTALNKDSKSSISFTNSSRFSDIKLLELIAQTKGIDKLEDVLKDEKATRFLTDRSNGLVPSLYVYNFIAKFAQSLNPKSHLDPWLTYASPCNFFDFGETLAYCLSISSLEIINTFFGNRKTQIHKRNRLDGLKSLDGLKNLAIKFDLITSFPPFCLRQEESIEINGFLIPNDLSASLLIQSALILNDNGKAIFLVAPSFILDKETFKIMNKLGLFVDAVFAIPRGALSPSTNISSNLIVITKQPKKKTFVAEISANEESNEIVLSNYKKNRNGKNISLGVLVDFTELKSFQSLVAKNDLHLLTRRFGSGYEEIPLINLGNPIQLKQQNKEEVDHISNSIYLPVIGNSQVITNPLDMKIKPNNYFQIQLDESKANAVYVSSYFNSSIGKKLRESLSNGGLIPRITKTELSTCILHLPDLSTQLKIIGVDNKINEIYLNVDLLKRELWNQPKKYQSIAKDLNNVNNKEILEHWIDTLPFPLSSILWLYYATSDNNKKIEHLFHFFEALSEFLSMIMLSSLTQDPNFLEQEYRNSILNMHKDWYRRTSFGNWKELTAILSKETRKYHNNQNKEKKDFCKLLYGNPSDAFLDMLSNTGIINILSDTNESRNKWKGHGGIVSEEENKQRLTILEQHLSKLRQFIGEGFDEARIVSPNTSSYESGVFTFNAKELVGARTPFNEIYIKSLIPLDKKKLYLTHSAQNKPIELLPFIKFVESSGAVYFYTSIESSGVRWVSYHFEKESEINNEPPNSELLKAFSFLKNDEKDEDIKLQIGTENKIMQK